MSYRIKNWNKFQHFKDRKPAWIKLYRELLDDKDWHELPAESAKLLVMLWLIASENDGQLPGNDVLAFRLRTRETTITLALNGLSHWLERDDISVISNGYQVDSPEIEKERERETEKNNSIVGHGPTPQDLVLLWNKTAHGNLPRVKFLTENRKRQASCRLKDNPSQEFWEAVVAKVNRSPLLRGEKGGWKANFDWILNPTNLTKVVEGNYDEK